MAKFRAGEIVKHKTGSIRGAVENVIEVDGLTTSYYIAWDSGDYRYHFEHELNHLDASDRPQIYKGDSHV